MATRILLTAPERFEIHAAVCRARRQNLRCSLCSELAERAATAAHRWGACRDCGAEDYLIGGRCEPCRVGEAA
jgi:hypothetical protein